METRKRNNHFQSFKNNDLSKPQVDSKSTAFLSADLWPITSFNIGTISTPPLLWALVDYY